MSRPSHRPAASGAGHRPDAESASASGLEFSDSFGTIATESAPPPCAVDIERAITEGKRARRKRAVRVTSGAAAGLAVVCVIALVTTGGSATPLVMVAPAALPITGSDPFIVGARFGWLPGGVVQDTSILVRGALSLGADSGPSAGGSSKPDIGLSLHTFPSGFSEQAALAQSANPPTERGPATAHPQAAIDGRPAYTVTFTAADPTPTVPGFHHVTLLWQMSNGQWAELSENVSNDPTGTDTTGVMAQARHVAETVTPEATASALPFSIAGLPSGAQVTTYSLVLQNASPTGWNTQIGIEVAGVKLVYDEGPVGEVLPMTLGPSKCTTGNGLEACVTLVSGHLSGRFAAGGGLQALADDVSLRGLAPATWTTDVFPEY